MRFRLIVSTTTAGARLNKKMGTPADFIFINDDVIPRIASGIPLIFIKLSETTNKIPAMITEKIRIDEKVVRI